MRVAYYERGVITIKDLGSEETRVDLYPTDSHSDAVKILTEVTNKHPDARWKIFEKIRGKGPWRVQEKL